MTPDPATNIEEFNRQGFLVIADAVTPQARDAAHSAAHRLLASSRARGRDRSADGKDGFRGVVDLDAAFLPLMTLPAILAPITALLGPNLHLMSSHLIALPSIADSAQRTIRVPQRHGWHRDMGAATRDLGPGVVPRLALKAAIFLTEPDPECGTTMVLPGSHLRTGPVDIPPGSIDPEGATTPAVNPCDALLFENRTWHAGGLNISGRPRLAVMMQYGYRWLARLDDDPDQPHANLTPLQRQLLGTADRHPDGSVAAEASAATPLAEWMRRHTSATAQSASQHTGNPQDWTP